MSVSLSSVVEGFLNNCCLAPASAALVRPTDGCSSTIHQTDTHIQSAGNTAQIITSAYPSTSSVGSTQTLETHTGTTRIETTDALAPQQRHQTSSNPVQLSCDTKQIQTTTIELPTPSPTITQPEVSPAIAPAELSPTSMPPVSPPAGVASVLNYLYTGQLPLHHSALYQMVLAANLLRLPAVVALGSAMLASASGETEPSSSVKQTFLQSRDIAHPLQPKCQQLQYQPVATSNETVSVVTSIPEMFPTPNYSRTAENMTAQLPTYISHQELIASNSVGLKQTSYTNTNLYPNQKTIMDQKTTYEDTSNNDYNCAESIQHSEDYRRTSDENAEHTISNISQKYFIKQSNSIENEESRTKTSYLQKTDVSYLAKDSYYNKASSCNNISSDNIKKQTTNDCPSSQGGLIVRPTPTRLRTRLVPSVYRPHPLHSKLHPAILQQQGTFIKLYPKVLKRSCSPSESTDPDDKRHKSDDVSDKGPYETAGAIIDIAACDGPVFFERVLNKAYAGHCLEEVDSDMEINVDEVDSADDASSDDRDKTTHRDDACAKLSSSASIVIRTNKPNATTATYHCIYCNHSFKSHYCYQKHMRRHINPIAVEMGPRIATQNDQITEKNIEVQPSASNAEHQIFIDRRHDSQNDSDSYALSDLGTEPATISESVDTSGIAVSGIISDNVATPSTSSALSTEPTCNIIKAASMASFSAQIGNRQMSPPPAKTTGLDLNVQYFPCKTCGSKFPSYYFVHKHRRLCHGDDSHTQEGDTPVVRSKSADDSEQVKTFNYVDLHAARNVTSDGNIISTNSEDRDDKSDQINRSAGSSNNNQSCEYDPTNIN